MSNGSHFCGDFDLAFHFRTTKEACWRVEWSSAGIKLSSESVTNNVVAQLFQRQKYHFVWFSENPSFPMRQQCARVDWNGWQEPIMFISFLLHAEWHPSGGWLLAKGESIHTLQICKRLISESWFTSTPLLMSIRSMFTPKAILLWQVDWNKGFFLAIAYEYTENGCLLWTFKRDVGNCALQKSQSWTVDRGSLSRRGSQPWNRFLHIRGWHFYVWDMFSCTVVHVIPYSPHKQEYEMIVLKALYFVMHIVDKISLKYVVHSSQWRWQLRTMIWGDTWMRRNCSLREDSE